MLPRIDDGDLNPAVSARNIHRHFVFMAVEPEINARLTELQVAQNHLVKERG